MKKDYTHVYQFKISLKGTTPRIWRCIQVPETYTFWDLSIAIQCAMDWKGHHLHEFRILNPQTGAIEDIGFPDEEFGRPVLTGWEIPIAPYFTADNYMADFLYDFGDDWEHQIMLEAILPRVYGVTYPRCVAGERKPPPDDVGSICGFEEFVEAMNNPEHEEHDEWATWYGEDTFESREFRCAEVTFLNPRLLLRRMLRDP